jgi:hypothetical protein
MGIMATTVRDTGRQHLRWMGGLRCALMSNRPGPRTRVAKMAEVIAIGASIRIRNLRRCSRPLIETEVG